MGCETCKKDCEELQAPAMVPLYAVEGDSFRKSKTMKLLAISFVVSLIIIALTIGLCGMLVYRTNVECVEKVEAINRYWIDFLAQYDIVGDDIAYSQDGKGINIIGDGNGVTGYESEADSTAESYEEEGR